MSDSEGELGIFEEPEGFYEAEKEPTFVEYTLQSGLKLNLRLVGHNPLWVGSPRPVLVSSVYPSAVVHHRIESRLSQVWIGKHYPAKSGRDALPGLFSSIG